MADQEEKTVIQVLHESPLKEDISRDEKSPQIVDKGAYKLEQKFFSGGNAGFSYFVLAYKNGNEQEAQSSLEAMLKKQGWSAVKLVDLVNSAITSSLRAKATNTLSFEEGAGEEEIKAEKARLLASDPCLVTPTQAEEYTPGERDVRSIGGKMKAIQEILKSIKDPTSTPEQRTDLLKQVSQLQLEITEMIQKMATINIQ